MPFHPQPLIFLALGLVAGTLVPSPELSLPHCVSLLLAAGLAVIAIARPAVIPLHALVIAAAATGAALAASARGTYGHHALPAAIAEVEGAVMLEGRAASDPRIVDDELRFEIDADMIVAEGEPRAYDGRIRIFVKGLAQEPFGSARNIRTGNLVRAWVDLRRPEPVRTPGGFNQLGWAMREGIHAFATCKNERLLQVEDRGNEPRAILDQARDRLEASWRHVEQPLNRAVTASMVLGDEGSLDSTTRDEFRSAGLLHLLVVSGSQVAALIIGLRRAMPRTLRIAWSGCLLECVVLLVYCLLAGAGNSIVRATFMAMAFSVAVRADLHRGGTNFLAAAALILLVVRPLDAPDPGAQMSFAATMALVAWAGGAARWLRARLVPTFLADVVAATLLATMAVAPLSLAHFHRFSLIALPANVLAAPLAVLLLYGSLATAALDGLFPQAAPVAGFICNATAQALRWVAHHASDLDPDWRGPSPPLVLMTALLGLVTLSGWRRVVLPLSGLLALLTMSGLPSGDGRLHLWFLDVGQGDSLIIETPSGRVGVIDAGPAFRGYDAGERVVGEALWALGHPRLEFMAVTHRHADHEGGAPFLARHLSPERIYVNGTPGSLKGLQTRRAQRGDSWSVDGVAFRVLGPDPGWSLPRHDENARSLVIEIRFGSTSVLVLGDASMVTESLLRLPGQFYDVVKVGHHGALTSSSEPLVRQTRPRLALISVGSRNRFSHPSARVVERWERAGTVVWRTDQRQTLHVTSDGRSINW